MPIVTDIDQHPCLGQPAQHRSRHGDLLVFQHDGQNVFDRDGSLSIGGNQQLLTPHTETSRIGYHQIAIGHLIISLSLNGLLTVGGDLVSSLENLAVSHA